jgi:hypothetical protein
MSRNTTTVLSKSLFRNHPAFRRHTVSYWERRQINHEYKLQVADNAVIIRIRVSIHSAVLSPDINTVVPLLGNILQTTESICRVLHTEYDRYEVN